MTRTRTIAAALLGAGVLALSLTGCMDKHTEPYKDAPRGSVNKAPMDVIENADGFSQVGAKCDGPNRVYVLFHGDAKYGSVAVVAGDPRCTTAGGGAAPSASPTRSAGGGTTGGGGSSPTPGGSASPQPSDTATH